MSSVADLQAAINRFVEETNSDVTPLFHGLEIRTSVVIVIFLTLGA